MIVEDAIREARAALEHAKAYTSPPERQVRLSQEATRILIRLSEGAVEAIMEEAKPALDAIEAELRVQ